MELPWVRSNQDLQCSIVWKCCDIYSFYVCFQGIVSQNCGHLLSGSGNKLISVIQSLSFGPKLKKHIPKQWVHAKYVKLEKHLRVFSIISWKNLFPTSKCQQMKRNHVWVILLSYICFNCLHLSHLSWKAATVLWLALPAVVDCDLTAARHSSILFDFFFTKHQWSTYIIMRHLT